MFRVKTDTVHINGLVFGLLVLLFTACSPAVAAGQSIPVNPELPASTMRTVEALVDETSTASMTSTPGSIEQPAVEQPLEAPTIVPPAENRPKPEDWREWPVIPAVSARARQIYETGLAAGTDPRSFSKVGDCQAIKNVLLGMYDKPGGYTLRENTAALEETIQQFAGSFDRDGEAVQGGYNAASVLTPLMSNPDVCEPGEDPLTCEVRVHNPSIMLISLEVWWDGRSPDVYEKNMRRIVEYAISRGIVPVLSTKADNVEGDHSINLATARLAYEYDLPLWNWWLAAQSLPNRGLDPDRPDGFHISQEHAWPERSFTALQSLDAVWRAVRAQTIEPTATPQPTQAVVDLVVPETAGDVTSAPEVQPSTGAGITAVDPQLLRNPSGFILLSVANRSGETVRPQGIYLVDPMNGVKHQIAGEGNALQAVHPSGTLVLFSSGNNLYQSGFDGNPPVLLTNRFYDKGSSPAVYLPDGNSAAFLAGDDGNSLLVLYPLDGSAAWKRLSPAGTHPLAVYPSPDNDRLYWLNGTCTAGGTCEPAGVNISGYDGSSTEYLKGAASAGFSADHRWLAFNDRAEDGSERLNLATTDLTSIRPQENIGKQLLDYSWSPDGTRLSLLTLDRSDYSGQWLDVRNLVISTADMGTKILPSTAGINPRAVWSPDSAGLLLTGTQQSAAEYSILMQVMDAATGTVRDLTGTAGFSGSEFIYTTRIFWVPTIK